MSKSLQKFSRELQRTWRVRQSIDWTSTAYSPEKAYVMAVFSKIAYLVIPDYEIPHHSLAKIIPCLTYHELLASGQRPIVSEFLRQVDLPDVFVLISPRAIAVTIVTRDLIIVSLRGTRPLYLSDWSIDLHATPTRVHTAGRNAKLHTGFFTTASAFVEGLASSLQQQTAKFEVPPPIYIVGHSLGGALAAIVQGLDGKPFHSKQRLGFDITYSVGFHSGYSFGMPRYGDQYAVNALPAPFHTLNQNDLVPCLPPKWLGFSNPRIEYVLRDDALRLSQPREPNTFVSWFRRAYLVRGVRHHFIERYIRQLGKAIGIT